MAHRIRFLRNLGEIQFASGSRPKGLQKQSTILIYDRKLVKAVPGFSVFLNKFPHSFSVTAGEDLKSIDRFQRLANEIHTAVGDRVARDWTVVAVGGGSVGDAAGFFASVYKRGLRLVHIPTTWLAAIDSSHGGKTALNLAGAKNQIGTFYPADETILVRAILESLSMGHSRDALGELAKAGLLTGGLWRKIKPPRVRGSIDRGLNEFLWRKLPMAIAAKMQIVNRDPTETRGDRQLLNLGHTFGHVIEASQGLTHGLSVGLGLCFAIDVSEAIGCLTPSKAEELRGWLAEFDISKSMLAKAGFKKLSALQAARLLRNDKKRASGDFVWFIVLRDFGRAERRQLSVNQILKIAKATGWIR